MPYKDPEKRKKHRKEYYEKTKKESHEYYLKNKEIYKKRNQSLRKRNREFVNAYKKENGCSNCGYNNHACALDFHHVKIKNENINKLVRNCNSIEGIKEEIKKCIVLCSNCHRVEHYKK